MRAVIENTDDMLRAGMSFQVAMKFPGDTYPSVNPLSVQWGTDGAFVWAIKDGKAKRTPVRIIQRNTESVLVEADLTDEDLVVTEGHPHRARGRRRADRKPRACRGGARRDRRFLIAGGCRQMTTQTPTAEGEKGITALFVRRPVLAFVINTLIAVAGLAAFYGVEIRELPDVDRPVITVNTDFTGASAETIDRELTAVLEGAVSRVSGVKAISSASSFGAAASPSNSTTASTSTSPRPTCATQCRASPTSCPRTSIRRASSRPTPIPTPSCGLPSPPTPYRSRT